MKSVLALLFCCALTASAQALQVRLVGSDGQPVPDAMVTAEGLDRAAPPVQTSAVVDQRNKRFEPFVSVVAPGTAVRFPNSDDTRHHVYSFSPGNAFELQLYRRDDAPPVEFENPGIVTLGCNIHDNMKAYIVVTENAAFSLSNAEGLVDIDWLPAEEAASLRIWHPQLSDSVSFALSPDEMARGSVSLTLPMTWSDPQAEKSVSQLESLLKRFSRDDN